MGINVSGGTVASLAVTALVAAGITIGTTTITADMAAKLDRSVENVAYPEDFVSATTDGGTAYTLPDGGPVIGIDGGVLPPAVYPYNGKVDWTGALQAALTSLAPTCGTLQLRPMPYYISAKLTVPNCVSVKGHGRRFGTGRAFQSPVLAYGTVLISQRLDDFSFIVAGDQTTIDGVNFDAKEAFGVSGAPLAGSVIDVSGKTDWAITNVTMNRAYRGIVGVHAAHAPTTFTIRDNRILNALISGIYMDKVVWGTIADNIIMNLQTGIAAQSNGLEILNGSASFKIYGNLFQGLSRGIYLAGGAQGNWTTIADDWYIAGNTFDAMNNVGIYANKGSHGSIIGNLFTGSYGTYIDGAADSWTVVGNVFTNLSKSAVVLKSVTNAAVGHNTFSSIAMSNAMYSAVEVAANVNRFSIVGNRCAVNDPGYGAPYVGLNPYCWSVAAGTSDDYAIVGNAGTGVTGSVTDNGTGEAKAVEHNPL